MDELIGLLAALLFWRVVLATVAGLFVAVLLAWVFPGFGPGPVLLVTLLAFTIGAVWQAAAPAAAPPSGTPKIQEKPVSRIVAFLGIAVMGVAWGAVAEPLIGSTWVAFLLVVVAPFVVGPVAGMVTRRPLSLNELLVAALALAVGFFTPWLITQLLA